MNRPGHLSQGMLGFSALILINNLNLPIKYIYKMSYELNFYIHKNLFFANLLLFITLFGAIVPDIDFKLKYFFKKENRNKTYLYHRQITHSLSLWLFLFFISIIKQNIYLFFFTYGALIHLLGDILTGSIPVFLWGKYYNFYSRIGIDKITSIFGKNKIKIHQFIANIADIFSPLVIATSLFIYFYYFHFSFYLVKLCLSFLATFFIASLIFRIIF